MFVTANIEVPRSNLLEAIVDSIQDEESEERNERETPFIEDISHSKGPYKCHFISNSVVFFFLPPL